MPCLWSENYAIACDNRMHPQRPKLVDQVARELRDGIESRKWEDWLPQERVLARELYVSRATLRLALQRLRLEGLVESLHHRGNRILPLPASRRLRSSQQRVVNLVVPGTTGRLPRIPVNWMDELRAQLATQSCQLRVIHAEACYSKRPERALEKLVARDPADCWLVRLSTLPMQEWMAKRELPAIIAGTTYSGIDLPYIDVDQCSVSRHAAGVLIAAGHREIAFFKDKDRKAGDMESERGFAEATVPTPMHPNLHGQIVRYEGSVQGMIKQLNDLMFRRPVRPTALIVALANYCFTVWSYLGYRGLKIPDDVSVVAHLGTSDLAFLFPEPANYRLNVTSYAQKMLRLVLARMEGDAIPPATLVIPDLFRGASIHPLPPAR